MTTRVRAIYKPNHKSFAAFMLSEQAHRPLVEAAKDIAAALSVTVHRSSGPGGPEGHLADSYKVNESAPPVSINGSPRVVADVYSDHPGAAPDEFGGKNQPAKHWLANVAAAWHVPRKGGSE